MEGATAGAGGDGRGRGQRQGQGATAGAGGDGRGRGRRQGQRAAAAHSQKVTCLRGAVHCCLVTRSVANQLMCTAGREGRGGAGQVRERRRGRVRRELPLPHHPCCHCRHCHGGCGLRNQRAPGLQIARHPGLASRRNRGRRCHPHPTCLSAEGCLVAEVLSDAAHSLQRDRRGQQECVRTGAWVRRGDRPAQTSQPRPVHSARARAAIRAASGPCKQAPHSPAKPRPPLPLTCLQ